MGKFKSYYVEGNFDINNMKVYVKGKISAVSDKQANYYCCLDIRKDLEFERFIDLTLSCCTGMNSTMNCLRNSLPEGLTYYLKDNDSMIKQNLKDLKAQIKTSSYKNTGNIKKSCESKDNYDDNYDDSYDLDDFGEWWSGLSYEEQDGWNNLWEK